MSTHPFLFQFTMSDHFQFSPCCHLSSSFENKHYSVWPFLLFFKAATNSITTLSVTRRSKMAVQLIFKRILLSTICNLLKSVILPQWVSKFPFHRMPTWERLLSFLHVTDFFLLPLGLTKNALLYITSKDGGCVGGT